MQDADRIGRFTRGFATLKDPPFFHLPVRLGLLVFAAFQTTAQITSAGRTAIAEHWKRLDALRKTAASWSRR